MPPLMVTLAAVVLNGALTATLLVTAPLLQTNAMRYEVPGVRPVALAAKSNGAVVTVGASSLPLLVAAPPPPSSPATICESVGSLQPALGPIT
jgi:hypothetical protein